jgi:16S rRNA U516 pseudouridylate synthase RsuA-like enzyme
VTRLEAHTPQNRKLYDSVGHTVVNLKRIKIGTITDAGVATGKSRKLSDVELKSLGYKKA